MNVAILSGNLCDDVALRTMDSGVACANFRLAVQREFTDKATGKRECDFLPVTAWRQSAEFLAKYAAKGDKVTVRGAVQTRSYQAQDGTKRYITEINADRVELDRRKAAQETGAEPAADADAGDELPF